MDEILKASDFQIKEENMVLPFLSENRLATAFVVPPKLRCHVITFVVVHGNSCRELLKTLSDKLVKIVIALATAKREDFSFFVGEIPANRKDSTMANG